MADTRTTSGLNLDWIDALKAFAILGILLNHLVEVFGPGPWFTNPSQDWPEFSVRMQQLLPSSDSILPGFIQWMGWLGDSGPGIFILLSGLGLTLSALRKSGDTLDILAFYRKRLFRIYPLYIVIHVIILAGLLFIPANEISIGHPKTLLSLLGIRGTDSLFFFINPSWWFIWLILQLYIAFPFLYRLMHRTGLRNFLIITLVATFLFRLGGIVGIRHGNMYFWMTGMFFGTRLAEFTLGMGLAWILLTFEEQERELPPLTKILGVSLLMYLVGLGASFTYVGSIFSNVLVTLGLSGIFYFVWEKAFKGPLYKLSNGFAWIGISSYAVYLLHQPLLSWISLGLEGGSQLIASIVIMILCFPLGRGLEILVQKGLDYEPEAKMRQYMRWAALAGTMGVMLLIVGIEPVITNDAKRNIFMLFLFISGFGIVWLAVKGEYSKWYGSLIIGVVLWMIFMVLFLLPKNYGHFLSIAGLIAVFSGLIIYRILPRPRVSLLLAIGFTVVLLTAWEIILRKNHPIETAQWGEFPALEQHTTRTYGLKPAKTTRLKYNNYDYFLQTNSLGLASPEIEIERATPEVFRVLIIGDAFSMPEGMEYESAYPAHLQKNLEELLAPRPVEVINAGVTGYGPAEQYPQLVELGELLKPNLVLHQFFINEFYEASLKPEDRLKYIGFLNEGPKIRTKLFGNLQLISHLRRLGATTLAKLTHTPAPWKYDKALLGFYEIGENSLYDENHRQTVSDYLKAIKAYCKEIGADYSLFYVPGAPEVSKIEDMWYFPDQVDFADPNLYDKNLPLNQLKAIAEPQQIEVFDLTEALASYPAQPVYFPESWHWNPTGHEVAAFKMAQILKEKGYLGESTRPMKKNMFAERP